MFLFKKSKPCRQIGRFRFSVTTSIFLFQKIKKHFKYKIQDNDYYEFFNLTIKLTGLTVIFRKRLAIPQKGNFFIISDTGLSRQFLVSHWLSPLESYFPTIGEPQLFKHFLHRNIKGIGFAPETCHAYFQAHLFHFLHEKSGKAFAFHPIRHGEPVNDDKRIRA